VTAQKFLSVSLCAIFLSAIKLFTITTATQRIIFGSSYAESIILPFRHSHRLGKPFSWPAPNSRLLSSENSVDLYWVGDIRGPPLEKNSILCALCISTATTFRSRNSRTTPVAFEETCTRVASVPHFSNSHTHASQFFSSSHGSVTDT